MHKNMDGVKVYLLINNVHNPKTSSEVFLRHFSGLPRARSAWTVGPAAVKMALDTPVEFVNIQLLSNLT